MIIKERKERFLIMNEFIWKIAVKKAIERFVQTMVAQLPILLPVLEKYGMKIELDQALLVAGIMAGLEYLRNWYKHRQ